MERRPCWWHRLPCGRVGLGLLGWVLQAGHAADAPSGTFAHRLAAMQKEVGAVRQTLVLSTSATSADGSPEVRITGAHQRPVNGLGSTNSEAEEGEPIRDDPDGLGHLIVGDNEPRGVEEDRPTGSHHGMVGQGTTSPASGAGGRQLHTMSGDFAVVSGGRFNTASGEASSASGGRNRTAAGEVDGVASPPRRRRVGGWVHRTNRRR
jgi:hypothetical protein